VTYGDWDADVNRGLHSETEEQGHFSDLAPLAMQGLLFIMTELLSGGGVAAYLWRKNPAVTVAVTAVRSTNAAVSQTYAATVGYLG
jgi:hypothetical protein